jgi:hypothetical protein
MEPRQAAQTLEVIRTLMERTCQYQLLTARAGLAAGALTLLGASAFLFLDADDPGAFAAVWGAVFAGSLLATCLGTILRGRARGERVWSRQARTVLIALAPSLVAGLVLTAFFFYLGNRLHLYLPGVWMLCYGQGALATSAYAPAPIRYLGVAFLPTGAVALALGPDWAVPMMVVAFGCGHIALGVDLLLKERRERAVRLYRDVA